MTKQVCTRAWACDTRRWSQARAGWCDVTTWHQDPSEVAPNLTDRLLYSAGGDVLVLRGNNLKHPLTDATLTKLNAQGTQGMARHVVEANP